MPMNSTRCLWIVLDVYELHYDAYELHYDAYELHYDTYENCIIAN